MKTNIKPLFAVLLLATACTTGSRITSGGNTDDLYYTPGDARPVVARPEKEVRKPQPKSVVAMQVEENEQGKVVNSYIVPKSSRKDPNAYYFEDKPAYSDTVMEYRNDKEQVTINNYYEGEEMSYASRIRSFYNPYFYDPFWDPFWSPYYGFGYRMGWGMNFGYYPFSYGFYDPWFDYGYGYGWGGYYPGYWGGYYPGYWGWGGYNYGWGGGWGGYALGGGYYYDSGNHYYGKQNHTGRTGGSSAVRYGLNTRKSGSIGLGTGSEPLMYGRGASSGSTRSSLSGSRSVNNVQGASSTRLTNSSANISARQIQGTSVTRSPGAVRGETLSNLRRSATLQGSGATMQSGSSTRSASQGNYTPTYNRPRMNTQPSYNSSATRQYSAPQNAGSNIQSGRYSRPSVGNSYNSSSTRTQSSGSYQRGPVSSSPTYSGSGVSGGATRSSSSRSYEPSYSGRSFSAPSNSGSSSGSFSGGGGGGGGGAVSGGSSGTRSSSGGGRVH